LQLVAHEGALYKPTILRRRCTTIGSMGHDQFDAAGSEPLAQQTDDPIEPFINAVNW